MWKALQSGEKPFISTGIIVLSQLWIDYRHPSARKDVEMLLPLCSCWVAQGSLESGWFWIPTVHCVFVLNLNAPSNPAKCADWVVIDTSARSLHFGVGKNSKEE